MSNDELHLTLLESEFEHILDQHASAELGERPAAPRSGAEEALRDRSRDRRFRQLLDALPAAVYTTDAAGRITFYNEAAVKFSGRRAQLGIDQWCVTWRLYWPDGRPLPHDECPMAIAIKQNQPVRGAQAVAERPDGTRVPFAPHPTPLRDASGALVGAVNLLLEIKEPEPADLEGVRVLIVAPDVFLAADLDLAIDEAGGVAVAIVTSVSEAITILDERSIDAALVSLPLRDEHGPLVDALLRQKVPFVVHEGHEEHVLHMLGNALRLRRDH